MYDRASGPDLAALIMQQKLGRTFEQMSADCGGIPAARRIQQMTKRSRLMKNFPDPETVTALAHGLRVPVKDVVMASARSLGVAVDAPAGPDALVIADAGALPEPAQQAIRDMARELITAYRRA